MHIILLDYNDCCINVCISLILQRLKIGLFYYTDGWVAVHAFQQSVILSILIHHNSFVDEDLLMDK